MQLDYDVVIVGGGATGLFCAAKLGNHLKVALIEKTGSVGNKLLISGNGQCNFTHAGEMKDFLNHYGENGNFLKNALYHLSNTVLIDFFINHGVDVLIRDDQKVFPKSLKAKDIVDCLVKKANCEFFYNHELKSIEVQEDGVLLNMLALPTEINQFCHCEELATKTTERSELGTSQSIKIDNELDCHDFRTRKSRNDKTKTIKTKYLVLATGGASFPETGSTGDIANILKKFDIKVRHFSPALSVPKLKWNNNHIWKTLTGINLPNATIILYRGDKKLIQKSGSVLFTHTGLSGPLILDNSRYYTKNDRIVLYITQYTEKSQYDKFVLGLLSVNPKKIVKNITYFLKIPSSIIDFLSHDIPAEILLKQTSQLSKQERLTVFDNFFSLEFLVIGLGDLSTAMCSQGGVCLSEINKKDMSLIKYPNIFVAGECMDIDGDTGGYNIHAAFAMGNLVAKKITCHCEELATKQSSKSTNN